ncbi:NAD(P)H-dependent oxidoreductase [Rubeoparvulum massiliense]|uniref:NAD(P)H-dependent oxidoreductase n=1 Tax=Rubeoparvulum massiliense TaxID=1631346 RepID=UPI00065E4BA3|nr:NAD(P)H-dependent oxidoreductase [Rubeoparvulum massiliense]
MKLYVLHASMYGHTAALADAIAKGAEEVSGSEVILKDVEDLENVDELMSADAIIWGSSSYFGEPNPKMATFLGKLGRLWATGVLQGKIGGVFGSSSSTHGGIENLLRALQTPMMHHGMIIVSNTGALTEERIKYGCPYGACATIPVETSKEAPMNLPSEAELELAKEYGALVAKTAWRFTK